MHLDFHVFTFDFLPGRDVCGQDMLTMEADTTSLKDTEPRAVKRMRMVRQDQLVVNTS